MKRLENATHFAAGVFLAALILSLAISASFILPKILL